jgi:O-antigen ligase
VHLLNTILVAVVALTGLNFSLQQSLALTQLLIPVVIACCGLSVVRQVLLVGELPNTLWYFMVTTLVSGVVYGSCVLAFEGNLQLLMDAEFLKVMARFSLISCAFLFSYLQDWTSRTLQSTVSALFAALLSYLMFRKLTGGMADGFIVEKFHSNQLGIMGVVATYYGWLFLMNGINPWIAGLTIVPGVAGTIVSNSRGAWLCLGLFVAFFFIQATLRMTIASRLTTFPLVIGCCLTTILGYVAWTESEQARNLSQISEEMIGKPLDTGRANLWKMAADEFRESPWIGVGLYSHESWTRKLKTGSSIRLSVHSYYWAILHEAGIIGLAAVLAVFGNVWYLVVVSRRESASHLTLAFFAAVLVQQISEVQLSTGTFTIGTSIWMAIAAGASLANRMSDPGYRVHVSGIQDDAAGILGP